MPRSDNTIVDDLIDDDAPVDDDVTPNPAADITSMTPAEKRALYARYMTTRDKKQGELDAVTEQLKALEQAIVEDFMETGEKSARLVTGQLVHLVNRTAVNKKPGIDSDTYLAAIRAADLGVFIKPNVSAQALAKHVRELEKNDEPLPDVLANVLNVHHIITVGVRKA